jgi:flagellin-like protein
MSIGGSSLGRRGMSPLIATVLLMAFAVALGGMVMNWSIDASTRSGDCAAASITVIHLCSKDGAVLLTMRNDRESVPLQGIKLNLVEASIESTLSIKDSGLEPGQQFDREIPAPTSSSTRAEILGVVGGEGTPITCTEPLEVAEPLQPC